MNLVDRIKPFVFPRKTGTEGHLEIQDIIGKAVENLGLSIERQPFSCRNELSIFMAQLGVLFLILTIGKTIGTMFFYWISVVAAVVQVFVYLIAEFGLGARILISRQKGKGGLKATNLVSRLEPAGSQKLKIVYSAHYDTKSLHSYRIPVYRLMLLSIGLFDLLIIALGILKVFPSVDTAWRIYPVIPLSVIELICIVFFLVFYIVKNESPGANDNATGVLMLLDILERYKDKPLQHIAVECVFTDAEETGLTGAAEYVRQNVEKWKGEKVWNFNYDMLAGKTPLFVNSRGAFPLIEYGREIEPYLKSVCRSNQPYQTKIDDKELVINHKDIVIGTDAAAFFFSGIPVIQFQSKSKVHSKDDDLSVLKEETYEMCRNLTFDLIDHLDQSL